MPRPPPVGNTLGYQPKFPSDHGNYAPSSAAAESGQVEKPTSASSEASSSTANESAQPASTHTRDNHDAIISTYQIRKVLRPNALDPESFQPLPGGQDISDVENCSIYAIGFPRNLLTHEFVDQLETHRVGKISSVQISPPTDDHPSCAVRVTMWTRAGAERLMEAIGSGQICFPDHELKAVWNPCKVAAQDGNGSRVMGIVGPPYLVAPSPMVRIFGRHFTAQIEQVIAHLRTDTLMVVEYRFTSYKDQAAIAYGLVGGAYGGAGSGVSVHYFNDPCDPDVIDEDSTWLERLLLSRQKAVP